MASECATDANLFDFDRRLGIYFSVQSASLSLAAVTLLLAYALIRWLKRVRILRRSAGRVQTEATDSSLFLNLMVADLVQAIGNMPSIRWMREGTITEGSLCTAQAVIKQIGIDGVALTSLAIAIHTFSVLVLRWRGPQHISKYMVIGVWVLTALVVGIPNIVHRNGKYYGNTGNWCWIMDQYKTERIVSEYLWVWLAAFSMVILYGIMFLVMRGFIVIENGIHWRTSKNRVHLDLDEAESEEERETRAIANLLLFYPAVYIFCVLPNSIARWLSFSGGTVPYQFTLFASALFAFSGMFNVLLFVLTRPELVVGQTPVVDNAHDHGITHATVTASTKYGHLPMASEGGVNGGGVLVGSLPHSPNEKSEHVMAGKVLYDTELVYQSPQMAHRALPPTSGFYPTPALPRLRTRGSGQTGDDDEEDFGHLP